MTYHPLPQNGQPPLRLLHDVCDLPREDLDELLQRFIHAKQLKLMQSALSTVVALAVDNRLRRLGRQGTMLFIGPPGTGKSTLARLLPQLWAKATGCRGRLTRVNVHAVASREHGQSQKNVVELFAQLKQLKSEQPVFAVFDELETIATDRDEISGKTSPIDARSSVNAFLEQLDRKPSNCLILATTNVPQLLDAAVRSRFDFVFTVGLPTAQTRLQALLSAIHVINPGSAMLRPIPKSVVTERAALTEAYSFREVEALPLWCVALHGGDVRMLPGQVIATANFLHKARFWEKGCAS